MSDPAAKTISVSDLTEGTYIFEVSVTNANGLNTSDRISVTVVDGSTAAVSQSAIPGSSRRMMMETVIIGNGQTLNLLRFITVRV